MLYGGLAQLGEHLLCKQGVVGSIPSSSTTEPSTKQCLVLAFVKKLLFFKKLEEGCVVSFWNQHIVIASVLCMQMQRQHKVIEFPVTALAIEHKVIGSSD